MTTRRALIYLGDVVHNYIGKGPFMFPINIGFVAGYAYDRFGRDVDIRLFKFPDELVEALHARPPDILGLGNYTWNVDLNNKLLAYTKRLAPHTITVFGGPNIHLEAAGASDFLRQRPALDIYVENQGEPGFASIMERFLGGLTTPSAMTRDLIGGCIFYDHRERRLVRGTPTERIKDLDVIPSPYLTGLLDRFFDQNLIPIIETNRGCPYACTFCAWGNAYLQKVNVFSLERVREELRYIGQRVSKTTILMIADANFGIMDQHDLQIAEAVRELQESSGYPRKVSAWWAKNKSKGIVQIAEVLGESVSVTASFQSLDETALRNVKRSNIKLSTYREIIDYLNAKSIPSVSEIIIGLPGETKESHLKGLRDLFDLNCSSLVCYNLRLLDGTELATPRDRERFALQPKFRLVDTMFGKYGDFVSIECEEMVHATATMPEEDILFFRPLHWLIQFCWNYKYHFELLKYLQTRGINPADFFLLVMARTPSAPKNVRKIFEEFEQESRSEWFDSPEALVQHYSQPAAFDAISKGEFGKLNFKYMFRVLLECKKEFDHYLRSTALEALRTGSLATRETEQVVSDIVRFLGEACLDFGTDLADTLQKMVYLDWDILGEYAGAAVEARLGDRVASFDYDILAWREGLFRRRLEDYGVPGGVSYTFFVPRDQQKALAITLQQFQTTNQNLTLRKMSEYMRFTDLFYRVRRTDAPEPLSAGARAETTGRGLGAP